MLNQVIMVGRVKDITDHTIVLGVSASTKNKEGKYETYVVETFVNSKSMLNNIKTYCHPEDIVGIKGHFEHNNRVVADKITFLSSHNNK